MLGKVAPWTWETQALISLSSDAHKGRLPHANATLTWAATLMRTVKDQGGGRHCADKDDSHDLSNVGFHV